ncbi:NAD-dependent epimerase/dehydratase family protein [Hyphomonas sp.]|uniref:NAD-dependent epimerase/dehydratase family protein n=1 Tax=Hyphomonas sp. TaxID=87 RepID=UPI001BCD61FA|nr:NAD-dependent epimerase/dehydratase family protein [Hyphomonas sp.]
MRVLILGGDGYCGWPTALRLSERGGTVAIVDNFSRRRIDLEQDIDSLIPIALPEERCAAWAETGGGPITFHKIDVAEDFDALANLVAEFRPDAVVHFAEQRSVPYSMMSSAAGRYTIRNNLMATINIAAALVETGVDAHLVHLGSIGVYGYETLGYEVPEGYLKVRRVGPKGQLGPEQEMLHPFNPVSKYHLTKVLDHLGLAYFAAKNGLRATDLHQGTVWGVTTAETRRDPRLANRFDHDTIYGTVVNRFAVQAALGKPISVYGSGEQTRGFIHIEDALQCIEGALATPPRAGERVKVVNQISESRRILDLAHIFADVSGSQIAMLESPRSEPEANELAARNCAVFNFGVSPTLINRESVAELIDLARDRASAVDLAKLYPNDAVFAG